MEAVARGVVEQAIDGEIIEMLEQAEKKINEEMQMIVKIRKDLKKDSN